MTNSAAHIRDAVAALPREDWKYTDLARAVETGSRWAESGEYQPPVPVNAIRAATATIDADWLVFCNGRFIREESATFDEAGIRIEVLKNGMPSSDGATSLARLNNALLVESLRVTVESDRRQERPIALLALDSAEDSAVLAQTRVDIHVARHSGASIVEWHLSEGRADLWSNTVFNVELADNATLNYQRVQQRRHVHDQTNQLNVSLGADAVLRHNAVDLGGRLTRNDLTIDIANAGAEATFDGLYVSGDGQHVDNHTRADHRAGPARSAQEYRGILDGRSRSVWNGKAVVHAGADGTDAEQANHNLLLSEHAEIDAKPELEIYADEVKCSHGTTVGQLDERALFYLRSRGLRRDHAERVLTRAFATSIVERSPIASLRDWLGAVVEARLRELSEGDSR